MITMREHSKRTSCHPFFEQFWIQRINMLFVSRLMKAGITLEFKEVVQRVSQHMIANMDKMRVNRLKDGVAPGAGVKWTAARTLD